MDYKETLKKLTVTPPGDNGRYVAASEETNPPNVSTIATVSQPAEYADVTS